MPEANELIEDAKQLIWEHKQFLWELWEERMDGLEEIADRIGMPYPTYYNDRTQECETYGGRARAVSLLRALENEAVKGKGKRGA